MIHKFLKIRKIKANGFALPLIIFVMLILIILSFGETMTNYSVRLQAVNVKAKTEAMLAAEAGYERAIFQMCQQTDILGWLQAGGGSDVIDFGTSTCAYEIDFIGFLGSRPVFEIKSTGKSGRSTFTRIVDVNVMQETAGWAMGACRVPLSATSTQPVYFKNGEIVDMPLHINKFDDNPDVRDIWINTSSGAPRFLRRVEMGESRKTSGGSDKYSGVIPCFEGGIYFDQPNVRITDETAVQSKVNRFLNATAPAFIFTPAGTANFGSGTTKYDAVQLEFFVDGNIGKVRITNDCSVRGRNSGSYDYKVLPGSGGDIFQQYKIYDYHVKSSSSPVTIVSINDDYSPCYVSQTFGGYTSQKGGQIFVNGNVVIGGDSNSVIDPSQDGQIVKGRITVVATGNIWIADNIKVDGPHVDGKPKDDNPNVLGLIALGVIKVVNPTNNNSPYVPAGQIYQPIGNSRNPSSSYPGRWLPDPTIVEAAITVGGGGWCAEDVGNRREYSGSSDVLILNGSITEVVRGPVGTFNSSTGACTDGYEKNYYIDNRLMTGILPGDIWFTGKYIPAPAGWHDYGIDH